MVYNVDEGTGVTFTVTTSGVPNGTTLYWTVENNTTINADFVAISGTVTINSGTGTFIVTPAEDLTTESGADEIFTVSVRTGSTSGTVVASSASITVNDTSLTPPAPGSAVFATASQRSLQIGTTYWTLNTGANLGGFNSGTPIRLKDTSGNYYNTTLHDYANGTTFTVNKVSGMPQPGNDWRWGLGGDEPNYYIYSSSEPSQTPADWSLGTTWTIEFWMNANTRSDAQQGLVCQDGWFGNLLGGDRSNAILVARLGGNLSVGLTNGYDNNYYTEPAPGIWTHVAVVNTAGTIKTFYNGVEQTKLGISGSGSASYTNNFMPLYIGRLGGGYGGWFDGEITNVRITDTAVYNTTFTPDLAPVSIPGHTRLLWTPTDQVSFTDTGDYALTIINNNNVAFSTDYPSLTTTPLSLVFTGDNPTKRYLEVAPGNHFNLGTTWTIEYWSKATDTSGSSPNTVMGQQYDAGSNVDIFYYNGRLGVKNGTGGLCTEPTPGIWRHVALSSDTGYLKVYIDGRAAYEGQQNYSLSDATTPLYIGRRGTGNFQYFNGKITNIRICNTAQYSTDFTPDVLPAKITGTKFLLNPTSKQVRDQSDNNLVVTNYNPAGLEVGVTYSTEYPQLLAGVVHPYNGGTLGTTYCLLGNPKLTAFQTIPLGARITSNIAGFGVRTVTLRQSDGQGGWQVSYDATGLTGFTSVTHTFNFIW
jgi:hypothetical protein